MVTRRLRARAQDRSRYERRNLEGIYDRYRDRPVAHKLVKTVLTTFLPILVAVTVVWVGNGCKASARAAVMLWLGRRSCQTLGPLGLPSRHALQPLTTSSWDPAALHLQAAGGRTPLVSPSWSAALSYLAQAAASTPPSAWCCRGR